MGIVYIYIFATVRYIKNCYSMETNGNDEPKEGLFKLGFVLNLWKDDSPINRLSVITGQEVTKEQLDEWVESPDCNIEHYNGSGYTQSSEGTKVTRDSAKYITFNTWLQDKDGNEIIGWFTRGARGFQGIEWGTSEDFRFRTSSLIGKMAFDTLKRSNTFVKKVAETIMPETWEFKNKTGSKTSLPILRSYLRHEVDRLFYEAGVLKKENKIIYNSDSTMIWFNTNLLDVYGHDLHFVGTIVKIGDEMFIKDVEIAPSKVNLRRMGFDTSVEPDIPCFFSGIDEIIFHHEWDIDKDKDRYTHIIEERRARFPKRYQNEKPEALANKLDNAISLAQRIARRNYRFIVPIYYPRNKEISLVMPIYLEGGYSDQPDFGLILTPRPADRLYTMATILSLNEVYMDARLIAKPEEAWLKPEMIQGEEE